ncbi:MAG: ATP-binding protein [Clostridiales bacterium]|nr:ATP-binding protein [Clostridiales bacterium]MDU3489818.1 ATP-binding protein [Clostridiales bacterium]
MHKEVSKLILYGADRRESILFSVAGIYEKFEAGAFEEFDMVKACYREIHNLLVLATDYAFDKNLWQNYLTFFLVTDENPFSITCEKQGAGDGSVNKFALNDFSVFRKLFHYDFTDIEESLGISCFTEICNYKAIEKPELMYNKNVSEKTRTLSEKLAMAGSDGEFFNIITEFYKNFGVGMFGLNKAFRIQYKNNFDFIPVNNMEEVHLSDLIGYERQKEQLVENTLAFVQGRKANNVLLYGDSGTGKSTSIKAIVNEYYDQGLRMIEIYKHQFKDLSNVIAAIKNRNYRFIIYMDDLSFEEFEIEYKFLKAVIEGGVETKPENILIYATSNRRHLIKETWNDKNDMEHSNGLHRSDTVEEKLSLFNRFGLAINYGKPSPEEFYDIVLGLAEKNNIRIPEDKIRAEANKWELKHGGVSGRTAQQFINYLLSMDSEE